MRKTYVLDANALLDFVEDGAGAHRVEQLIKNASAGENSLLVSVVNWGEVFYYLWQKKGEQTAKGVIARLQRLPFDLIPVDAFQCLQAGEIKVRHRIPYVDCLAASLAAARHAVLVTSDRDFEKLGRRIQILWLTRP